MSTSVTYMGESLIDFVPLNAAGQGEGVFGPGGGKPEDQGEVLLMCGLGPALVMPSALVCLPGRPGHYCS
jgi:hypothetical protein